MKPTENHALIEIMRNTLEETSSLHHLLQQESQALSDGQSNEIESIAEKKQASVLRINKLTKLQNQFFESKQLRHGADGEAGLNRFLENLSDDDPDFIEVQSYRKKINQNLENCKVLNDSNGASIELMNRHTQRAIELLRNQANHPVTYGPDGSRQQNAVSRARISV